MPETPAPVSFAAAAEALRSAHRDEQVGRARGALSPLVGGALDLEGLTYVLAQADGGLVVATDADDRHLGVRRERDGRLSVWQVAQRDDGEWQTDGAEIASPLDFAAAFAPGPA